MNQNQIILTTPEAIKELIIKALEEYDNTKSKQHSETKVFSINKVSKILGVSHTTVKKLVENGTIQTTPDNKISERELNNYLTDKQ